MDNNPPDSLDKQLVDTKLHLERAMERNVSLQRLSMSLIKCQSMTEVLELATERLVTDMSFEKSFVALRGQHGVTIAAAFGYNSQERQKVAYMEQPALEKILQQVGKNEMGVLVSQPDLREQFGDDSLAIINLHTFLAAPIIESGTVVGCLIAGYSQANEASYVRLLALENRDATWFSSLANQVSSMATNAALIASLRERTDELHAEEARLSASIEGLSLGFVLIDTFGHIILKNQALSTILSLKDAVPLTVDAIADALPGLNIQAGIMQVQHERAKLTIKSIDVGSRILRILLTPVTETGNSQVLGVAILFEDITEEKLLDRSKDEFLSIASHELRTPLTAIKGNTSMILSYYTEALRDASLKELIDDVHEASTRLIEIVNDFLDASRIEQGKMVYHKQPFAIDEVIERIFYEMGQLARQKDLYLKINVDALTLQKLPLTYGDKDRTKQILYNLLGNAIKFTETGGVTVDVRVEGDTVKTAIQDTGRGIPPEQQKLLFRKFQQASGDLMTRDTTRGTGLGLYISRLMAEGMGGELALEHSEAGQGSMFSFSLPIAQQPTETPVTTPSQ
ncbi:MAG TPA: GAF domain-containing sensor histidine kinase [Candidatus Saccharimonadales bacterium]|nr:GAF domain-containing sensor histidine kinase [Candidatus Saccharimonadales bacterium]